MIFLKIFYFTGWDWRGWVAEIYSTAIGCRRKSVRLVQICRVPPSNINSGNRLMFDLWPVDDRLMNGISVVACQRLFRCPHRNWCRRPIACWTSRCPCCLCFVWSVAGDWTCTHRRGRKERHRPMDRTSIPSDGPICSARMMGLGSGPGLDRASVRKKKVIY